MINSLNNTFVLPFSWRRLRKPKVMFAISLANFKISFTSNVTDKLISIKANGADVVNFLPVCHVSFKPKDRNILLCLNKLISRFFVFKLILFEHFLADAFERSANFNVHHVRSSQFSCQSVKQSCRFACIRIFVTFKKTFDRTDSIGCFTCCANGGGSKANSGSYSSKVQNKSLHINFNSNIIPNVCRCNSIAGVVLNFDTFLRTGAGRNAQDSTKIDFSDKRGAA